MWDDQIFITSAENKTGKRLVFCFDVATGRTVWQRDFPGTRYPIHQRQQPGDIDTYGGRRAALPGVGHAEPVSRASVDRKTGKDVWQADLGPYASEFGYGSSPIRYEDLLILSNDQDKKGSLVALEAATGKKVWELARQSGNATYSTPCVYQPANQPAVIIFTNWKHGITAVDPHPVRWPGKHPSSTRLLRNARSPRRSSPATW